MDKDMDEEVKEILREEFFRDWLENASKQEIIEKLIQNDERAKMLQIAKQKMALDISEDFANIELKDFEKYLLSLEERN